VSAVAYAGASVVSRRSRRPRHAAAWVAFAVVAAAQAGFGIWMASRGFRFGDAFYRSTSALSILFSSDPKLANVGFVWVPLPTLLNLPWILAYPVWPGVVSSGAASALSSAVCGGATAAIQLLTARRLGVPRWASWSLAALVALHPMLFLYAGTGMAEGVTVPFVVGAVCGLLLFWHTGTRWWVCAAGVSLALAVATVYQAVPFGAALFAVLAAGVLWGREARPSAPQGRARAIEGLGLLLLVPPVFAGLLWIGANAVIMGDPLFFVNGAYGYASYQGAAFTSTAPAVEGDLGAIAAMLAPRTWPFLVPLAALLAVRALDRRLWRVESAGVVALSLSVTAGLIVPMAWLGSRMDFLRYHHFALFVAAGWALHEIATSRRPRRAAAIVLAGWVLAIPAALVVMADGSLAPQEQPQLRSLVTGKDALALGYGDPVVTRAEVARHLERTVLDRGAVVLLDSYQGAAIAAQVPRRHADRLLMTFDRRFDAALADPVRAGVDFVLMPDPAAWPQDVVGRERPRLWGGGEPGFRLAASFDPGPASHVPERWRLFAVGPGARVLANGNGGPR